MKGALQLHKDVPRERVDPGHGHTRDVMLVIAVSVGIKRTSRDVVGCYRIMNKSFDLR